MAEFRATVIVPACDARATIGRCVAALVRQQLKGGRLELLVVDDGSADNTGAVAAAQGATVLRLDQCRGPAAARNLGAREAKAPFLLFTDADCEPEPDWAEALLEELEGDPSVVATKGTYSTEQSALVARVVQLEYEERYRRMARRPEIDFIDTYCAGFRRDAFLASGGFDETFRKPSVEDQELSFRLARQGARMTFIPRAVVRHRHADTVGIYAKKKFRIGYYKARVLRRHPDKAVSDSHTPQGLKLQLLLAWTTLPLLAIAALPFTTLSGASWILAAGLLILHVLLQLPLVVRSCNKDIPGALASLPLFLVRSYALGAGLILGVLTAGRPGPAPAPESPLTWSQVLQKKPILLNLGGSRNCHPHPQYQGYVSVDLNPPPAGWAVRHDLRLPFPLPDSCVHRIHTEDFLEHITVKKIEALLSECHRVLRPGGMMRIGVPDYANPKDLPHLKAGKDSRFPRHVTLTNYQLLKSIVDESPFPRHQFYHFWEGGRFVQLDIDYALGMIRRTPDNDPRCRRDGVLQQVLGAACDLAYRLSRGGRVGEYELETRKGHRLHVTSLVVDLYKD